MRSSGDRPQSPGEAGECNILYCRVKLTKERLCRPVDDRDPTASNYVAAKILSSGMEAAEGENVRAYKMYRKSFRGCSQGTSIRNYSECTEGPSPSKCMGISLQGQSLGTSIGNHSKNVRRPQATTEMYELVRFARPGRKVKTPRLRDLASSVSRERRPSW